MANRQDKLRVLKKAKYDFIDNNESKVYDIYSLFKSNRSHKKKEIMLYFISVHTCDKIQVNAFVNVEDRICVYELINKSNTIMYTIAH